MTTTDLALGIPSSSPLARLETARRLLAEVRRVDDAKAIHDFAEAARVYARQARLGLEAQNDAAEIKLRAERRLGELLAARPKQDGGQRRGPFSRSRVRDTLPCHIAGLRARRQLSGG